MMDFFTALVFVYELQNEKAESIIWFKDYESCYNAQYKADPLYDMLNGKEMYCLESNVASRIVKPKVRNEVRQ